MWHVAWEKGCLSLSIKCHQAPFALEQIPGAVAKQFSKMKTRHSISLCLRKSKRYRHCKRTSTASPNGSFRRSSRTQTQRRPIILFLWKRHPNDTQKQGATKALSSKWGDSATNLLLKTYYHKLFETDIAIKVLQIDWTCFVFLSRKRHALGQCSTN